MAFPSPSGPSKRTKWPPLPSKGVTTQQLSITPLPLIILSTPPVVPWLDPRQRVTLAVRHPHIRSPHTPSPQFPSRAPRTAITPYFPVRLKCRNTSPMHSFLRVPVETEVIMTRSSLTKKCPTKPYCPTPHIPPHTPHPTARPTALLKRRTHRPTTLRVSNGLLELVEILLRVLRVLPRMNLRLAQIPLLTIVQYLGRGRVTPRTFITRNVTTVVVVIEALKHPSYSS